MRMTSLECARLIKKSPNSILNCLNSFCKLLGQNINLTKSKIIVSKNCPINTSKAWSKLFNIKISNSFGKYLDFPIINTKPRSSDYQFILDKMDNKMALWKSNFLSMAGRTTLAAASLNSIPNHVMKYSYLPTRIIKHIDKIQKNFICGFTINSKKIHLLPWDTLRKDKEKWGLGIQHSAKEKNPVTQANLSWRLLHKTKLPWAQILTSLYSSSKN